MPPAGHFLPSHFLPGLHLWMFITSPSVNILLRWERDKKELSSILGPYEAPRKSLPANHEITRADAYSRVWNLVKDYWVNKEVLMERLKQAQVFYDMGGAEAGKLVATVTEYVSVCAEDEFSLAQVDLAASYGTRPTNLCLSTLPTDILALIVHWAIAEGLGRLWISGDRNLQSRLVARGVVKSLKMKPRSFPSLLSQFTSLESLTFDDYTHHSVTLSFVQGLDASKFSPSLLRLDLRIPDALAALVKHSLRELLPNLLELSILDGQYEPAFSKEKFLDSLPRTLTILRNPSNIYFGASSLRMLPKTLTKLKIGLDLSEDGESQVRAALSSISTLKTLSLHAMESAIWAQLVPSTITKCSFHPFLFQLRNNDPFTSQRLGSRAQPWHPTCEDVAQGLPQHLQSLALYKSAVEQLTIDHIASLPLSLTKLGLHSYHDEQLFDSNPAFVKALPPSLTELRTHNFVISSPETWAMRPPALKSWWNLRLDPGLNFTYPLTPAMHSTPEFDKLIDDQVGLLSPHTTRLNAPIGDSNLFSKRGALGLVSLPLTKLIIKSTRTSKPDSAVVTLLQQLPRTLTQLRVDGDWPMCLKPDDEALAWPSLRFLKFLILPTPVFPAISKFLPQTVTFVYLTGDLPRPSLGEENQWNLVVWPPCLDELHLVLPSNFFPDNAYFWTLLPRTIRKLWLKAKSVLMLPDDWSSILPDALEELEIRQQDSGGTFPGEILITDRHLRNLPRGLRSLVLRDFRHDVTMEGLRALPPSLLKLTLGGMFSPFEGSPSLSSFFGKIIKNEMVPLTRAQLDSLDELLKGLPRNLSFACYYPTPGVFALMQRNRFEKLQRAMLPEVRFLALETAADEKGSPTTSSAYTRPATTPALPSNRQPSSSTSLHPKSSAATSSHHHHHGQKAPTASKPKGQFDDSCMLM